MGSENMDKETHRRAIDAFGPHCIAVRVRLLNRVVSKLYDAALRPLGLKVSQLNVLVLTAKLGLARPAQVCNLLRLDTSTLSRSVERLRAKGWLEVAPGEDARTQLFCLTAKGMRLLERVVPAYERAQQEAGELLGKDGLALLDELAKKLGMLRADR
jgi:DNA-binding MarR family transcriptional regulator